MAKINLLPWREARRQELQKEFLIVLGGVAVLALAVVLLGHNMASNAVEAQRGRNAYVQKHIDELNKQVAEIKQLEKKKNELLERMKVIQELQGTRPLIVRVFDELVRTLPDGVFYSHLTAANKTLKADGVAESNNRISSLMRRLDGSDWFSSPNLKAVKADPDFGEQASRFEMSFNISTPDLGEKAKE